MTRCPICGATAFTFQNVLWPELCDAWRLSAVEIEYINRQQGFACKACGNNLRSMALAKAILCHWNDYESLAEAVVKDCYRSLRVLEINRAGNLTPFLARLPGHQLIEYPDGDMMNLAFPSASFDLIVHSDTLEHVPDPHKGLLEINRVLSKGGACIYTVPIIVGRMTRSRDELPDSYHGHPSHPVSDYKVITEFGADAWTLAMEAGFESCRIHSIQYPAAIAIEALKKSHFDTAVGAVNTKHDDSVWTEDEKPCVEVVRVGELPDDFDPIEYVLLNPDLDAPGVDPIKHYLVHGHGEKRIYKRQFNPLLPLKLSPYNFDGLHSWHNHDFMLEPDFLRAYNRGIQAAGKDYQWYWRVHIGLWVAQTCVGVEGDFVECGVNRGFMSSAIMELLDWDATGKTFYLLDTFSGLDERFVSDIEIQSGVLERNKNDLASEFYTSSLDSVRANFSQWANTKIVVGSIPETLDAIILEKIAFLHLDLNCSPPEVATLERLWDKIKVGGMVLLDDYAYRGFHTQKVGIDNWAANMQVHVASLPTGQGLIVKTCK
jgi:SAM-dependent methyltransferase